VLTEEEQNKSLLLSQSVLHAIIVPLFLYVVVFSLFLVVFWSRAQVLTEEELFVLQRFANSLQIQVREADLQGRVMENGRVVEGRGEEEEEEEGGMEKEEDHQNVDLGARIESI